MKLLFNCRPDKEDLACRGVKMSQLLRGECLQSGRRRLSSPSHLLILSRSLGSTVLMPHLPVQYHLQTSQHLQAFYLPHTPFHHPKACRKGCADTLVTTRLLLAGHLLRRMSALGRGRLSNLPSLWPASPSFSRLTTTCCREMPSRSKAHECTEGPDPSFCENTSPFPFLR